MRKNSKPNLIKLYHRKYGFWKISQFLEQKYYQWHKSYCRLDCSPHNISDKTYKTDKKIVIMPKISYLEVMQAF